MESITQILARELGQKEEYVENIVKLLDDGNTVPFIARYRKEMHGTMDDQTIRQLADRLAYLRGLDARRDEVREAIEAQGKLTDELAAAIAAAQTLAALDDLYRPYRPKRRTRASVAREKGLAPLAEALLAARGPSERYRAQCRGLRCFCGYRCASRWLSAYLPNQPQIHQTSLRGGDSWGCGRCCRTICRPQDAPYFSLH